MTDSMINDLHDFHQKFGFTPRKIGERPTKALLTYRLKFMLEEITEMSKAMAQDDLAETLDGLVDLAYIVIGTAWLLNLPFEEAWGRVHTANMAKVRATDARASKRGTNLDVVKPAGWEPADVAGLLLGPDLALKTKATRAVLERQLDLVEWLEDEIKKQA